VEVLGPNFPARLISHLRPVAWQWGHGPAPQDRLHRLPTMINLRKRLLLVFASAFLPRSSIAGSPQVSNAVQKVLNMLHVLQKRVREEEVRQTDLFDKFMCYCKTTQKQFKKTVGDAKDRLPQIQSGMQETIASRDQLTQMLKNHQDDRDAAKAAVQQSTQLRNKERDSFKKDSVDEQSNIEALKQAVAKLRQGSPSSFLQSEAASKLQSLLLAGRPSKDYDREVLSNFLQQGSTTEGIGEVIGILDQMREDMERDLQAMKEQETSAQSAFEAMSRAKANEIEIATRSIEEQSARLSTIRVQLVQLKHDLKDTTDTLEKTQRLLKELIAECDLRVKDDSKLRQQRSLEEKAISETMSLLNDDALQSSPPSFIQITTQVGQRFQYRQQHLPVLLQARSTRHYATKKALNVLKQVETSHGNSEVSFLAARASMALQDRDQHSQGKGFQMILQLIDNMVNLLGKEQSDDDAKQKMCVNELAKQGEHKTSLEQQKKAKETEIASLDDELDAAVRDLANLREKVSSLDVAVKEATIRRKAENAEFIQVLSDNHAALEVLDLAMKRLAKFYNATLYTGSSALQTSSHSGITVEQEKVVPLTFVQVDAEEDEESSDENSESDASSEGIGFFAAGQQADTLEARKQRTDEIFVMLYQIYTDIEAENDGAVKGEKDSQAAYESFLVLSLQSRDADTKAIASKEGVRAAAQEGTKHLKDQKGLLVKELEETSTVITNLKKDCDDLLKEYEARKKARSSETEALQRTKAVLRGG